jgi:hypothetical protein
MLYTDWMKRTNPLLSPMPGVNGVFTYRGVPLTTSGSTGEWMTYAVIKVGGEYPGVTRLRARSQSGLLRLIDRHIDGGGEIAQ